MFTISIIRLSGYPFLPTYLGDSMCPSGLDKFRCNNALCIDINRKDDTDDDCGDKSDESNYTKNRYDVGE